MTCVHPYAIVGASNYGGHVPVDMTPTACTCVQAPKTIEQFSMGSMSDSTVRTDA